MSDKNLKYSPLIVKLKPGSRLSKHIVANQPYAVSIKDMMLKVDQKYQQTVKVPASAYNQVMMVDSREGIIKFNTCSKFGDKFIYQFGRPRNSIYILRFIKLNPFHFDSYRHLWYDDQRPTSTIDYLMIVKFTVNGTEQEIKLSTTNTFWLDYNLVPQFYLDQEYPHKPNWTNLDEQMMSLFNEDCNL